MMTVSISTLPQRVQEDAVPAASVCILALGTFLQDCVLIAMGMLMTKTV